MRPIVELFQRITDDEGKETNYIISDYGTCINTKTGNIIKPITDKTGRCSLSLHLTKKGKTTKSRAQFIMNAFKKEKPSPLHNQIDHVDGDRTNDCLYNFEWVTASENIKRAYKTGCKKRNNSIPDSKILDISNLLSEGKSNIEISKITGVNTSIISTIRTGRSHLNITENHEFIKDYKPRKSPEVFSEELKNDVRKLILKGYSNKQIIKELDLNYNKSIQYLLANIRRKINN